MKRAILAALASLLVLVPVTTVHATAVAETSVVQEAGTDGGAYAPRKKVVKKRGKARYVPPLSFAQKVMVAVYKVPWAHTAGWGLADLGGRAWAVTYMDRNLVLIDPRTPDWLILDVVRHEWAHISQGRTYGGLNAAVRALIPWGGLEHMADCGVAALGGRMMFYGAGCSRAQVDAARRIFHLRPA